MEFALNQDFFPRRLAELGLAADLRLALAVSGGPDSMALACLAGAWAHETGRSALPALIVDHGLRPESFEEATAVHRHLSQMKGVTPEILQLHLGKPRTGIMEKARDGRYACLAERCATLGVRYLALAHHQDDQAETILMRLIRGSGLDGLCGMKAIQPYTADLDLVRPFLEISKQGLMETCQASGVPYVLDPSNHNEAYLRPRLRQTLQILEHEGWRAERLGVMAGRLSRARAALETMAENVFIKAQKPQAEKGTATLDLDFEVLRDSPEEIRMRVILRGLSVLSPAFHPRDIRLEKFEKIMEALFSEQDFHRCSLGGFLFSRRAGSVRLEKESV